MTADTVHKLKAAAWLVTTVLTSLGLTVLSASPWGLFCTHLATAVGFGLGITGFVAKPGGVLEAPKEAEALEQENNK